ncbi:winged helix-turn-helix transcriptional regulator [Bordetella bronchiseptica]|uniref:winged helix-turn-helix transcriptional regulator n=1 Tax=Bordetella bronchiseptica TaxID=518 RepID=UPI000C772025|nr:winged helix-turn-helix transcriptional regulator [Bordetella bronchiseptica]AUL16733.1 transcriptional regulator [Bordetella bronchiseptica]QIX99766.1 transcriptional regulator [Bordetella bronchiseptica]
MAGKRSYEDGCAGAHALDLVGERWALLVVRELLLGPKRFTDLRKGLPGISPNVLTQRLTELEAVAVLRRRKLDPPAGAWVYELTDWGRELEPVILQLGKWGARSPALPREAGLSVDSLVLSFRAMFDPRAAARLTATYELVLDGQHFWARVENGQIALLRGRAPARPDATIEASPNALAALVYDDGDLDAAVAAEQLRYSGPRASIARFLGLFTLPEPAAQD